MEFNFNFEKCSDLGLVVKHGNKDNVVLFFDEVKEAILYRALLFRTGISYNSESFLTKAVINEKKVILGIPEYDQGRRFAKDTSFKSFELNNQSTCCFLDNELCIQKWDAKKCDRYKDEANPDFTGCYDFAYQLGVITRESFKNIKYITSLEASRNDLYINIDFLPCGNYIVILQAEDRNGKIIKEAIPYYFKVKESDLIEAINKAGVKAYCGR